MGCTLNFFKDEKHELVSLHFVKDEQIYKRGCYKREFLGNISQGPRGTINCNIFENVFKGCGLFKEILMKNLHIALFKKVLLKQLNICIQRNYLRLQ